MKGDVERLKINTVLGQVDSSELGITLMHEHVANIDWCAVHAFPGWYERSKVVDIFCEEIELLKPYGVKTIVDPTPINLGRDILLLQECSQRTGVNIIACTGVYWQEDPFYTLGVNADILAEIMIKEINEGMQGTGAKPGIIKCATQKTPGQTEANRNMVRAAAIAAKETGLPIYTHTDHHTENGLYQKKIFEAEGVPLSRIAFGHVGRCTIDYIKKLEEGGSWLGFDQMGYYTEQKWEEFQQLLSGKKGTDLVRHIFFSSDLTLWSDFGASLLPEHRDREKNRLIRKNGWRDSIFLKAVPLLKELGYSQSDINEILIDNPRRYFEGSRRS